MNVKKKSVGQKKSSFGEKPLDYDNFIWTEAPLSQ